MNKEILERAIERELTNGLRERGKWNNWFRNFKYPKSSKKINGLFDKIMKIKK